MHAPKPLLPGQALSSGGRPRLDYAAIGAVYWPVLAFVLLFGGVGLSVQTLG
jgi:hypothetical protein